MDMGITNITEPYTETLTWTATIVGSPNNWSADEQFFETESAGLIGRFGQSAVAVSVSVVPEPSDDVLAVAVTMSVNPFDNSGTVMVAE